MTHIEKIYSLLKDTDITFVQQALELIDAAEIQKLSELIGKISVDKYGQVSAPSTFPHGEYIAIALLGILSKRGQLDKPITRLRGISCDLPDQIVHLTELTELYLEPEWKYTSTFVLSPVVCKLTKLERLHSNNGQMIQLPENIGALTQLDSIEMRISGQLPKSFSKLSALTRISLSELTSISNELSTLTNLNWIQLEVKGLQSIPSWMIENPNVNTLSITSNQLSTVQGNWEQCAVESLSIHCNARTHLELPENLLSCANLRNINVFHSGHFFVPEIFKQALPFSLTIQCNNLYFAHGIRHNVTHATNTLVNHFTNEKNVRNPIELVQCQLTHTIETGSIETDLVPLFAPTHPFGKHLQSSHIFPSTSSDVLHLDLEGFQNLDIGSDFTTKEIVLEWRTYGTDAPNFPPNIESIEWKMFDVSACDLSKGQAPVLFNWALTALKVNKNQWTKYKDAILANQALKTLDVSRCAVNDDDLKRIADLPALKELNISHNNITQIPSTLLTGKLKVLKVTNNPLSDFSFITQLGNLEELSLQQINLPQTALSELSSLAQLKILQLDETGLTTLPDLTGLSLHTLTAIGNDLQQVEASHLPTSIQFLDLAHNQIAHTEGLEDHLPKLNFVDLRHNNLSTLPSLPSSTTVWVQGNASLEITTEPTCALGLDKQQFIRLEPHIRKIRGLELSLSGLFGNPRDISLTLPDLSSNNLGLTYDEYGDFSQFTQLESLHLNGNMYKNIPLLPTSLKRLEMDCNCLEEPTLSAAPNLEHLSLAHNPKVNTITCDEATLYPHLQIINLQKCGLSQLPSCIGTSRHIEELYITGNQIQQVPTEIFSKLPSKAQISMLGGLMDSLFPAELDSWDSYELPMDISVGFDQMEGHPFQVEVCYNHTFTNDNEAAQIFGYGVLSMGDIIIGIEQRLLARYSDEYGGTFTWKQFDSIEDATQAMTDSLQSIDPRYFSPDSQNYHGHPKEQLNVLIKNLPTPSEAKSFLEQHPEFSTPDLITKLQALRDTIEQSNNTKSILYNMAESYFNEGDCRQFNLSEYDLSGVQFEGADLRGCNLWASLLNGANLCGADLTNANLEGAEFGKYTAGYGRRSHAHTWYDDNTQWPTEFNPKGHEGLHLLNNDFLRQLKNIFVYNYFIKNTYSWAWSADDTVELMKRFGVEAKTLPVEIGPAEYVAMEHLAGFFSIPKDHFTMVEGVHLALTTVEYPPFQERMNELDELEFEGYPRIINPLPFVLSLFPDAIIHRYDMFSTSLTNYSSGYMEDTDFSQTHISLIRVGSEWAVFENRVGYGPYCDENFDGYGTISAEIFASKDEAIECYTQSCVATRERMWSTNWAKDTTLTLDTKHWSQYVPKFVEPIVHSIHHMLNLEKFIHPEQSCIPQALEQCDTLIQEWEAELTKTSK